MAVEAMTGCARGCQLRALIIVCRKAALRKGDNQARGHRECNDLMEAQRTLAMPRGCQDSGRAARHQPTVSWWVSA